MKTSAADAQRSRKRANDKTKIRCQSLWSQKRSESLLSSTGIPAPNTWTTRISCQRSISQRAFYDEILTIIQLFSISLEKTREGVLQFSGERLKKKNQLMLQPFGNQDMEKWLPRLVLKRLVQRNGPTSFQKWAKKYGCLLEATETRTGMCNLLYHIHSWCFGYRLFVSLSLWLNPFSQFHCLVYLWACGLTVPQLNSNSICKSQNLSKHVALLHYNIAAIFVFHRTL